MGKTDHGALLFPPPQFQVEQQPFYLFDILIWLCLRLSLKKRFGNYKRFACKPPNSMRVSLCSCFSSDGTSSWIMETSHAIAGGVPSLHPRTPHYPPTQIRPMRRPIRRYLYSSLLSVGAKETRPSPSSPTPTSQTQTPGMEKDLHPGELYLLISLCPGDPFWEEKSISASHSLCFFSVHGREALDVPSEWKRDLWGQWGAKLIDHSDWKWNHKYNKSSLSPFA